MNGNTVTYTSGQVSANNNASNKGMYFIFQFKYFLLTLYFSAKPISNTGQKKKKKPYDIFLPKASKKPSILPSKATLSTLYLNHKMGIAVSNSQTTAGHLDTRGVTQSKFLKSVLRWTNNLRYICDVRKQQLEFELFGDEPVSISFFSHEVISLTIHLDLHSRCSRLAQAVEGHWPTEKQGHIWGGTYYRSYKSNFQGPWDLWQLYRRGEHCACW